MKKVHHENRAKLILPDSDRIGYTRTELLDGFCLPRRPLLHSFRESPSCKKMRTLPEILQEEVLGDKNHWSSDVSDNDIRKDSRGPRARGLR